MNRRTFAIPLPELPWLVTLTTLFWYKFFGSMGFIALFFGAYIFLLRHPSYPITFIPATAIDGWIDVQPWALPFYFSLWFYVSLPPMAMTSKEAIGRYGLWMGSLCLSALVIFYFWPTAIPPAQLDWTRYPELKFLEQVDAAGNACPSLHVATAVFSWGWLPRQAWTSSPLWRSAHSVWGGLIVYSTLATKQHRLIDVLGGICLALLFLWGLRHSAQPAPHSPRSNPA